VKKLTAVIIMLAIVLSSAVAVANAGYFPSLSVEGVKSGSFARETDGIFSSFIPQSAKLREVALRLRYVSGQREFDGIYIADDGSLIKNMEAPPSGTVEAAVNALTNFVEAHGQRTYLMLVPTAAVIKQQEIAPYAAETLYNQRHMISDCYQQLAGTVTTVEVYQTLFNHRAEYIYYNTAENLTGLGGYYVYQELCSRMGLRVRGISAFDIDYGAHGYYGELASGLLGEYAVPDVVSMYEYSAYTREYTLTRKLADGTSQSHQGLYYSESEVGDDKTDMVFGGLAPVIEMDMVSPYSEWLLVFGDETAKSWLPFLANHYAHITYVDLASATKEMLAAIDVTDYQQVLFGYSTESLSGAAGLENLVYIE